MPVDQIKTFLWWSLCVNYAILLVWFGAFMFAHDALYRLHRRWFKLSLDTFDALHYGAIAAYKIGVLLLNLVPLAALYLTA